MVRILSISSTRCYWNRHCTRVSVLALHSHGASWGPACLPGEGEGWSSTPPPKANAFLKDQDAAGRGGACQGFSLQPRRWRPTLSPTWREFAKLTLTPLKAELRPGTREAVAWPGVCSGAGPGGAQCAGMESSAISSNTVMSSSQQSPGFPVEEAGVTLTCNCSCFWMLEEGLESQSGSPRCVCPAGP